jgi:hypothetical protein
MAGDRDRCAGLSDPADTLMAIRFYLVPKAGAGTFVDRFRPKYFRELGITNRRSVDYGREPTFLVIAEVTPEQHTDLAANGDVVAVPQNLDAQVGAGNLATVQNALESVNLPGLWVTATHTYRQIVRGCVVVMFLAQKLNGLFLARFFESGITLATTMADLTQTQRDRLRAVAEAFGVDYSGVTGATTMRQALRVLAQQLPTVNLMGETFGA